MEVTKQWTKAGHNPDYSNNKGILPTCSLMTWLKHLAAVCCWLTWCCGSLPSVTPQKRFPSQTPYPVSKEARIVLHNLKFSWLTCLIEPSIFPYHHHRRSISIFYKLYWKNSNAFSGKKKKPSKWNSMLDQIMFIQWRETRTDTSPLYLFIFVLQFNIFFCAWHKTAELLSITGKYKIEFWGREGEGGER